MAEITISVPSSKSWKTTLAGALSALGAYFITLDGYYQIVGQVLVIAGPVLMGLFAKDSNVTGGTVSQPGIPVAPVVEKP